MLHYGCVVTILESISVTQWLFAGSVALLMALLAHSTYRSGKLLQIWEPPHNLLLSLPDNALRLLLVVLCVWVGYALGPSPTALGWNTSYLWQDLLIGLAVGLLLMPVLTLTGQWVVRRWGPDVYSTRMLRCILPADRREWLGVSLALLPAAALEELLFRSLPLGGLGWLVPAWWLLWPLALFFGLLHWPQGGWGVVGTTSVAIVLSLLFLATGSIWAPLVTHYLLNVSQLMLARRTGLEPLRGGQERKLPDSLPD